MLFNWFMENSGPVFLVYGLTYIIIATAVLGHNKKGSEYGLAGVLWLFAAYALLHAPGDFIDMWQAISRNTDQGLKNVGVYMTYLSYLFLFEFGRRVLKLAFPDSLLLRDYLTPVVSVMVPAASAFSGDFWNNLDPFIGYILRFPGGIMAGAGIILYYENLPASMKVVRMRKYFYLFGIALVLWAVFCGLIRAKGSVFPSTLFNIDSFFSFTHIPVYVFRSLCGLSAVWSIIGMLNVFNHEKQMRIKAALDGERKTREYLARVIANITDPLVVTDGAGRIVMTNRALVSMIGREESDLLGDHVKSIIHADDWEGIILPVFRSGETFEGEVQLRKPDGEKIHAVYSITPIINAGDGSIDGFVGIAKETSIRKRIEAALGSMALQANASARNPGSRDSSNDTFRVENVKRNVVDLALLDSYQFLQTIIDSVDDEVIVRNRANRVEMMNYAARKRMLDRDRYEACCVNVLDGAAYPCDDCGTGDLVSVVKAAEKTVFFERNFTLAEKKRTFEVSASPLFGDNGEFVGIVEVGRDVTERRALERDVLKVYETERQRIGQDLHDDLMQNLIGIDVLLKMVTNSLKQKNASGVVLDEESARLKEVTHFLGNAVSKSRRLARGLCPVDMNCEGFLPAIRQMAEEITGIYNIDCSVEIEEEMPGLDELTMRHIYYIIREAVTNAVKHSGATGIDVELLKEGSGLAIAVRDNGNGCGGIHDCGNGLGLRIMKYRADIIGAELKIESASTGTSVKCLLKKQDD